MTIEFNDNEYRREHGVAPKGRGYWGFTFDGNEFWECGTLTYAKAECRKVVRKVSSKEYVIVKVMP